MSEKKNTFFGGAAILAAGVVAVKVIGALYKIPLANILGDTANGYFSSAYKIYAVLYSISTAGLPVALSKQVSEANALGLVNQRRRIYTVAMTTLFLLGLTCSAFMFFGAELLTVRLMGNQGAYLAAVVLSPAILMVCCISAIRGYMQGMGVMGPTALSQIIEASSRLIIGLALAWALLRYGSSLTGAFTPQELAAAGAIAGVTIGTILSLAYLVWFKAKWERGRVQRGDDTPQPDRAILSRLIRLAVPITLGASVVSVMDFLDTVQVQNRLQSIFSMTADQASALYGTYSAATTLYSLPSALMAPFTASLIPAISAARARRDTVGAARVTESAMRVAMLLACPMGFGLTALATPIVDLLYGRKYDITIMGPILAVLGIASIFTCTVLLCNAVLQASGQVRISLITMGLGGVIKVAVNFFMVAELGIQGAPWGSLVSFASVTLLDLYLIHRALPTAPRYAAVFAKPLLASGLMALAAWSSHGLLARVLGSDSLATLGAIAIAVAVYALLVVGLRAVSREDLALMPKGDKIGRILRIK